MKKFLILNLFRSSNKGSGKKKLPNVKPIVQSQKTIIKRNLFSLLKVKEKVKKGKSHHSHLIFNYYFFILSLKYYKDELLLSYLVKLVPPLSPENMREISKIQQK